MNHAPILCVDDEPHNLGLLRELLKDEYSLVFARDGENALRTAEKYLPCLILLDVKMPGMDGYEVCRRLKSNPVTADIPVIFITALSETISEVKGFEAGGVDYITKPFSSCVVLARVKAQLSLVRASKLEKSYRDAIYMLSTAGHYHQPNSTTHVWRIGAYSKTLATALGWPQECYELIQLAAPLHDIGMFAIPAAIRNKSGKLDADEFETVKIHPRIGEAILKNSDAPLFRMAAEIALNHHENWDGSGYPSNLVGEAIPESARIVAVADVFHALSMKRPYQEPWPLEKIIAYFKENSGIKFDSRIVTALLDNLPSILPFKLEMEIHEGIYEEIYEEIYVTANHNPSLQQALDGERN